MPATILLRVALLALLSLQVSASRNPIALNKASLRSCDESFPLASAPPPDSQDHPRRHLFSWGRDRRLVAIRPGGKSRKYYETGEYYAQLCPDGSRIDIRKLYRCNGGSCWNEDISQCTFECTWNAPTPKPTAVPTVMVAPTFPFTMTENPLLLSLKDLADRYRMNAQVRQAIIDYLFRKLQDDVEDLPFDMELLELTYAGRLPGQPHDLPLNAKVRGPPGISNLVLDYIQKLIRDNEQEIVDSLKKLDGTGGEAMKNARVVAGTFNMNDVVQGEAPTNSPTKPPTSKLGSTEKEIGTTVIMQENTEFVIPWWVWLLAAIVIILCCACCICGVFYRRWTLRREKNTIEHRLQINERVENRSRPRGRAPSVAESRATRTRVQQSRNHHHAKRPTTRSSRAPQSLAPTREVAIYKKESNVEPKETRIVTRPIKAFDSGTTVSALSAGFDPGAEYAMVLYDKDPRARDPTYYTDRMAMPDQMEPEGDIADASLMSDVRSQMEEAQREREAKKTRAEQREKREIRSRASAPDPHEESFRDDEAYGHSEGALDYDRSERSEPEGMLSDDLQSTKKKKKKKKSKRKSHKSKASSSNLIESPMDDNDGAMERMEPFQLNQKLPIDNKRYSLGSDYDIPSIPTSHANHPEAEIEILQQLNQKLPIDNKRYSMGSDYDSPSILTSHANLPEAEIEKLQEAGIYTYTSKNDDGYDGYEDEEEPSPKTSEKQEDQSEQHIFSSFTRKSSTYDRDGISSCNESYHA